MGTSDGAAVLVRPLRIARFRHVEDKYVREHDLDWPELREMLTRHMVRRAKEGPLWSPTRYRPNTTRGNKQVESLGALVLDFDHHVAPDDVTALWERWEYVIHSTHNHKPDDPRWRAVFPLARDVATADWLPFWRRAAHHFGSSTADPQCKEPARIYYLPSHPPQGEHFAWSHGGLLLDPDELPELPPEPRRVHTSRNGKGVQLGRGDYRTLDVAAYFQSRGHYGRPMGGGKHAVLCPWYLEHSEPNAKGAEDSDTVVWENNGTQWPDFDCKHAHCEGRRMRQVLALWPDADSFCAREYPLPAERTFDDGEAPREERVKEERSSFAVTEPGSDLLLPEPDEGAPKVAAMRLAREYAESRQNTLMYLQGDQWWSYRDGAWSYAGLEMAQADMQKFLMGIPYDERGAITRNRITEVLFLAKSLLGPHPLTVFNARPDLIPLKNGVLDLDTRTLYPHSPDFHLTHVLPYDYLPEAPCPRWHQFLAEAMMGGDGQAVGEWTGAIQEWFGYCLIPDPNTAQSSIVFVGEGGNGKGTATRVLERLVGDRQCIAINVEQLHEPYHRAQLLGKLVGLVNEPDRRSLQKNGGHFKAITGNDLLEARNPGERVFSFRSLVRLTISCNDLPATRDLTFGYFRRLILIGFWNRPQVPDTRLDEKLGAELSGIFNWALDGLDRFRDRGLQFGPLPLSDRLKAEYALSQDMVRQFVLERCEIGEGRSVFSDHLYQAFRRWCAASGITQEVPTKAGFGMRLTRVLREAAPEVVNKTERQGSGEVVRIRHGIALLMDETPPGDRPDLDN